MKILSIGTDRKLFEKNSQVLDRNLMYSAKTEEFVIIVFAQKKLKLEPVKTGNLYIYPTNSRSKLFYMFDAYKIGKKIINNWKEKKELQSNVVVSTQDPFETAIVGYFLGKKFNAPLQIQSHTDLFSKHFRKSFLNKLRLMISRFIIPRAQGFRVVSDNIKKSILLKFPNLKIIPDVLPIFVDIESIVNYPITITYRELFSRFQFNILMASRLTKEKRIDIALRAFKKITKEFPKTGLIIAGEGEEKMNLQSLINKLNLKNNVVFIGWQNDLIPLYKSANLFLLTSEYEGFGMTLIEAGASGCPIVTTKVGIADSELFVNNKNSFVCNVGDINCIFESISSLIHHNSKRELFKQEMQDSIKKGSITKEQYVSKYIEILEKLTKQHGNN